MLRVLVDGPNHTLGVLDLVDGILQLPVKHTTVRNDDDAVVDFLIGGIVEAREPVREPGDTIRLPAARRVLDKIVAPRAVHLGGRDQPADGVELMVAGEDHRLALHSASAARVLDLLINAIDEDVRAKDVKEPPSLKDFLPEVTSAVPGGMLRDCRPRT